MNELAQHRIEVGRATRRQVQRTTDRAISERATIEADEHNTAFEASQRIDNGAQLARRAGQHAAQLNREFSQASRDNPSLELTLRGFEETFSYGAQSVIHNYIRR